jgi:hypothetical protein
MSPTGRSSGGLRQLPGPGGRSKQTTHRQMVRLALPWIRRAASAEAPGQLAERKVRLLMLGFGRSGKTTFLTCMAQHFKGTPDGIRFVTDRASERKLNQQFEKLRQQGTFPKSTGQTESITFTVRGPVASRPIDVFTLTYMIVAIRDGVKSSPSKPLPVTTVRPSKASAALTGTWSAKFTITRDPVYQDSFTPRETFSQMWGFRPGGVLHGDIKGSHGSELFTVRLHRLGGRYVGSAAGKFDKCSFVRKPMPGELTVSIKVTKAQTEQEQWTATAWTAILGIANSGKYAPYSRCIFLKGIIYRLLWLFCLVPGSVLAFRLYLALPRVICAGRRQFWWFPGGASGMVWRCRVRGFGGRFRDDAGNHPRGASEARRWR